MTTYCWFSLPKRKWGPSNTQVFQLLRRSLSLCLQVLKTSFLLFRVLPSLLYKISFFSFRQILHFLFVGLNLDPRPTNFHSTLNGLFCSLRFQIWFASVALCLFSSLFISELWPLYLDLKVFPVTPVYVSTCPDAVSVTVAL